jgi:hypothetical protein
MAQIIDYVWVNEEFEISMESIHSDITYDTLFNIPPYCFDNIMIKPNQVFRNPFKSANDLIVLCDVYYVNNLTEPPEIILSEHNQRNAFNEYMSQYSGATFKISQKYNSVKNLFRQHKEMCNYIGIDVFGKPCEYSIFTEKENVYNYVWVSRYILFQLTDIEWGELLLIPNMEEDISNKVKSMEMSCIDELFDTMNL